MIAIPTRIRNGEALLTTIFGRAEQIALIDDQGRTQVRENPFDGGRELANWLVEQKVKTIVIRNMGVNPYLKLHEAGVEVFRTTDNRAPVADIVDDLRNGRLTRVTPENMTEHLRASGHRHEHRHHGSRNVATT